MNREQLQDRVAQLAHRTLVAGHYVNSDNDEPYAGADFCFEHANMVARIHAMETGIDSWVDSTREGADGHRNCKFAGCDRHLDFGGLTYEGIRSALGLTEANPHECAVYASELVLSAMSMAPDDPRWDLWEHHARRVVAAAKRKRRKR